MKILVKFPTRGRRIKFEHVLNRYIDTASNVTFLISYDDDDITMKGIENREWPENVIWEKGRSNSKIHACNRDIEKVQDWDILILASDDMIPQVRDWDSFIITEMKKHFPDTDGVLHFNDGYSAERLNTMCIMGRKYYDRFGYIYHPEYKSLWSDNEFMEVSQTLKKVKYFERVLFKHEHPVNIGGKADRLYQKNDTFYTRDHKVFKKRKMMNFEI